MNRLKQDHDNVNQKKLPSKVLFSIYILVTFLLVSSLIGSIGKLQRSQSELKKAGEQLNLEGTTLVNNQKSLDELKSSLYLEKVARDTLGLARDGEIVLKLPEDDAVKKLSPRLFDLNNKPKKTEIPTFQKWLQLLF